jgi:hypothetical protein
MDEAVSQLLDDEAVPVPTVLDWAACLRQCVELEHVPAEVAVFVPNDSTDPPTAYTDEKHAEARLDYVNGALYRRVPVYGAPTRVCDDCAECEDTMAQMRQERDEARRERDELKQQAEERAREKCERCETPLADTAHCSACVEELDSAVARLRRERDEARSAVAECADDIVRPKWIDMGVLGREEFMRAMFDNARNARMAARYLHACRRMHREWNKLREKLEQVEGDDRSGEEDENGRLSRVEWLRQARNLHAEAATDDCSSKTADVCWYVLDKVIRAMEADR